MLEETTALDLGLLSFIPLSLTPDFSGNLRTRPCIVLRVQWMNFMRIILLIPQNMAEHVC